MDEIVGAACLASRGATPYQRVHQGAERSCEAGLVHLSQQTGSSLREVHQKYNRQTRYQWTGRSHGSQEGPQEGGSAQI